MYPLYDLIRAPAPYQMVALGNLWMKLADLLDGTLKRRIAGCSH